MGKSNRIIIDFIDISSSSSSSSGGASYLAGASSFTFWNSPAKFPFCSLKYTTSALAQPSNRLNVFVRGSGFEVVGEKGT